MNFLRRSCLLKNDIQQKIEGRMEVTERRRRRGKQLLDDLNPLNAKLNPICHLLALLGAHPIFHVSRIRVKEKRVYCKLKKEALDTTSATTYV